MMGAFFGVSDADWKSIDEECGPGERVLWVGRPRPIRVLLRDVPALANVAITVVAVIFMLTFFNSFFGSFTFQFTGSNGSSGFFGSFGTLFMLVLVASVVFTVGPVLNLYLQAGKTVYAITSARAMIVTMPALWWGKSVKSYTAADMSEISRTTLADGSGDLVFSTETYSSYRSSRYRNRIRTRKIGFWGVPDVQQVEQTLLSTFKQQDR